jgi:transposase InsO family protein
MRVILSTLIFLLTFRFRRRRSLELEVIALRHQLCVLKRRQRHLPHILPVDRFIWSWLYRAYPQAVQWMQIVKPGTVVEWHRCGYLYYWRRRSCKGHVPWKVKGQLRRLIIQMYNENAGWGSGRIQGELLKLGYNVTKQTVAKYLAMYPIAPPPGWRTFLRNHMHDAAAIDMFVVISLSFRLLFAMVIIRLDRREILHVNATEHPTAEWLSNEVTETFKRIAKPKYLIRDRDSAYGLKFSKRLKELGIREHVVDKQSPWQNIYVERVISTIRRECLNHVIIVGERHLRRILTSYVAYYNTSRPHLSLGQDSPVPRPVQSISDGNKIDAIPQVGGLHHRYERRVA